MFLLLWSCDHSSIDNEKPASISIDGQTEYAVSEKDNVVTIKVVCDSDWSYELGGADWVSEVNRGDAFVLLRIAANEATAERSTTVKFKTPASGTAKAEASVVLKQAGKPLPATLELDHYGPFEIPAEGVAGLAIAVTAGMGQWDFEVVDSPSWLTATKGDAGLSIDVAANAVDEVRKATITFYTPSKLESKKDVSVSIVQEAAKIEVIAEDLSMNGTANSYMVSRAGYYCLDATVRGNGKAVSGLDAPATLSVSGAKLVWQTSAGMISNVAFADGKISFKVGNVLGNALIAALDDSGNIVWSWHIWFPRVMPLGLQSSTGDVVMEFNLGALSADHNSVESYGLLYQWGRKDPFPGSPVMNEGNVTMSNVSVYDEEGKEVVITHTDALGSDISGSHLAYSISHPTVCIGNRLQYVEGCRDWLPAAESNASLWGNPDGSVRNEAKYPNAGSKSYYDPCPVGWRVPPIATCLPFTKSGGMAWAVGTTDEFTWGDISGETSTEVVDFNGDGKLSLDDWTNGWHIYLDRAKGIHTYFPATTRYDGQYAMFMGSMVGIWGNYWTNTTDGKNGGLAQAVSFGLKDYNNPNYSITLSPLSSGSRADAYAVRCIKE